MNTPREQRPNIVLVVADSVRARNVSCYGYHRKTTPNLDRLASTGVRFENAFTAAPFTVASTSSILTGVYPSVHGLERYGQRLADHLVTLPEALQSDGYYTAGFVANPHVNADAGLTRGFDYFTDGRPWYKRPKLVGHVSAWAESGKALNNRIKAHLKEHRFGDDPFFFMVFYNDSHIPFSGLPRLLLRLVEQKLHSPDFERLHYTDAELAKVIDLYDQALQRADRYIGQLIQLIERASGDRETIFIVAADHGEGLDRRFERAGHGRLYENGIHVPMIVWSSKTITNGRTINDLVSTLDIATTICDLASIDAPGQFQGRTLRPYLEGTAPMDPRGYVVAEYHDSRCVRTHDWKLIQRGSGIGSLSRSDEMRLELYNIERDSLEDVNVAPMYPKVLADLQSILQEFELSIVQDVAVPDVFSHDELTLERLRGLGYVE